MIRIIILILLLQSTIYAQQKVPKAVLDRCVSELNDKKEDVKRLNKKLDSVQTVLDRKKKLLKTKESEIISLQSQLNKKRNINIKDYEDKIKDLRQTLISNSQQLEYYKDQARELEKANKKLISDNQNYRTSTNLLKDNLVQLGKEKYRLEKELKEINEIPPWEKKKIEELRKLKYENKIKEEQKRHEDQLALDEIRAKEREKDIEIENDLADIRRKNKILNEEKDQHNNNKIKELEREEKRLIAEQNTSDQAIILARKQSKEPKHLALIIGSYAGNYYGSFNEENNSFSINNFGLLTALGYWFDVKFEDNRGSLIGLFVSYESLDRNSIYKILAEQGKPSIVNVSNPSNYNLNFEVGIFIDGWFQFRFGYGNIQYDLLELFEQTHKMEYYSASMCLLVPIINNWNIGLQSNILTGLDFKTTSAKFSIISTFVIDFMRF